MLPEDMITLNFEFAVYSVSKNTFSVFARRAEASVEFLNLPKSITVS